MSVVGHSYDKEKRQCECGWKTNPNAFEHWETQWANHLHSVRPVEPSLLAKQALYVFETVIETIAIRYPKDSFLDFPPEQRSQVIREITEEIVNIMKEKGML